MRLARAIAMFLLLGMVLISNYKQPVRAVSSCEDDCANTYYSCNNQVDGDYQTCMTNCDLLYPWWSGCQGGCFSAREAGWAQCETDYNNCLNGCP